jgi:hypothetical protein
MDILFSGDNHNARFLLIETPGREKNALFFSVILPAGRDLIR